MKKKGSKLRQWRRTSQILSLILFLFLFIKTDYSGSNDLPYAVNILFRIDPFLAASVSLATQTLVSLMWPALIFAGLAFILGRFFCGWLCPMGTLLDLCHKFIPHAREGAVSRFHSLKYYLLGFLLVAAFWGLPAAGYFDPFSILVRGLAVSVYPAINVLATAFFTFTYQTMPEWVNMMTEPVYTFLKASVLPFRQNYFELTFISLFLLLTVFMLELLERRFFCRNICPVGAFYALIARFSPMRGKGGTKCGKCSNCMTVCRMGAIDKKRNISRLDCNLCLDCVDICPGGKISFGFQQKDVATPSFGISRRSFISTLAFGTALPFFLHTRGMAVRPDPYLIRPPGALPEDDFLGRCVRCGECMKVCIGNGLQPTFLAAGLEGLFSPRLNARTGYCEYNCTLCGQVCPTGALTELTLTQKHAAKIGNVFFDKNRCLPYAKGIPCIVCEEHCPTPEKAIQFREAEVVNSTGEKVWVKQPYLIDERCVGCGICETKCPLPGQSAVRLTSAGESRNPQNALPAESMLY
jgi:polyferredoxin/formate hydrogenlyase subunit 6/NADH:ubiquinone oxidoreductase subunit I